MMDMVCDRCGRTGIAWVGPLDNPTGTRCPHCGGENCQRVASSEDDGACLECDGDGVISDEDGVRTCNICGGAGTA